MTVQIVRKDSCVEVVEDVNEIEVNKASGRIVIFKNNYTTEKPCCDFYFNRYFKK